MRRLSWLVAPDPFLLGTAQCLLYLPVTRRPIHSAQVRTIDLLGRAAPVLQAFLLPFGPQCARAKSGNSSQERAIAAKYSSIQLLFQGCNHAPTARWRCEMKMLVTKMALATSIALATLVASEAASAQSSREGQDAHQAAPTAYDAEGNPDYQFGPRVTVKPGDVISGDSVIGRDPDPFIRDQLLREYDSGRPD
jgi:hypothetical protein